MRFVGKKDSKLEKDRLQAAKAKLRGASSKDASSKKSDIVRKLSRGGSTVETDSLSFEGSEWSGFFRHSNTRQRYSSMLSVQPLTNKRSSFMQEELSRLKFQKGKLYGREDETKLLMETLDLDKANFERRKIVLIGGTSGVGKTALAETLRGPVQKNGGHFVAGKYDFMQRSEPYSGITAACRHLCQIIFEGNNDEHASTQIVQKHRDQLRDEMGSAVHVFAKLIPTIESLFEGKENENDSVCTSLVAETSVTELQNRFQYAFKRFLKVVASWGPLVLMLDDLQWADTESFSLLEVLVKDPEIKGITIVGCYRDNEVDEAHLFSKSARGVEVDLKEEVLLTNLILDNLSVDATNRMLADVLNTDEDNCKELARVVHDKTMGNAFFVIQFLKILSEKEMLSFNFGIMKWVWSIEDIEHATEATDNVVELMEKKMAGMPGSFSEMLPVAACLGTTFKLEVLSKVTNKLFQKRKYDDQEPQLETQTDDWLLICTQEGFIEQNPGSGPLSYHWIHDKIREAAFALIVPEQLPVLKFRVGEILMASLDDEELKANAFTVANLLNETNQNTLISEPTKLKIASLNLEAGNQAMRTASFAQAVIYLQKGIERLPTDAWKKHYDMTLELFSSAAEAAYCIGNTEVADKHADAVIQHECQSLQDQFRAYNVKIDSIGNQGDLPEVIELCVNLLKKLGCNLPAGNFLWHTLKNIARVKVTLKEFTPQDIARMGEMTEISQMMAMRVLDKLATFTYMCNHPLLPLSIFKSLNWTIKHGISEFSPPAFATVGLVLCQELMDLQGGTIYAEAALSLMETVGSEAVEARTYFLTYTFVFHWTIMVQDCMKPLLSAYEIGMAVGDVETAMWSIAIYLELTFGSGCRLLESVAHDSKVYTKQMADFRQEHSLKLILCMLQTIENLRGTSEQTYKLKGEFVNDEEVLVELQGVGSVMEGSVRQYQFQLAMFFSEDEHGADIALEIDSNPPRISKSTYFYTLYTLSIGILCYGAARKTKSKTKKSKYISVAKKQYKLMKAWVKAGNPNMTFAIHFLDAEKTMLSRKRAASMEHYAEAARNAARSGFRNYHALVEERAGDAMVELGDLGEAQYRYKNALPLYKEWGAQAKVEHVEKKLAMVTKRQESPFE